MSPFEKIIVEPSEDENGGMEVEDSEEESEYDEESENDEESDNDEISENEGEVRSRVYLPSQEGGGDQELEHDESAYVCYHALKTADERTVAANLSVASTIGPTANDSEIKGARIHDDIVLPASQVPEASHVRLPSSTPLRSETQRVALTVRQGLPPLKIEENIERVPLRNIKKRRLSTSEMAVEALVRAAEGRSAAVAEEMEWRKAEAEQRLHIMKVEHEAVMRVQEAKLKALEAKRIYHETVTKTQIAKRIYYETITKNALK